ncbi:MAG TPA: DNA starvation/stationary phase protection protein Dps [Dongiaceae bacterium]|nr:DNA starvation/stationary phase protection protein Dps [Dongiaceae bacterium]
MYRTKNTLSENIRAKSIGVLNAHLAAAIDLHGQVKQAHWNVRGDGFIAIHELFDKVATELIDFYDSIAERVGALGGTAEGTSQTAVKKSFLKPYAHGVADTKTHIDAVTSALSEFGTSVRKAIDETADFGDADTADLFTGISRGIDQQIWLIESHLVPSPAKGGARK